MLSLQGGDDLKALGKATCPASAFECVRKCLDAHEALPWVFEQRPEYHLLDRPWYVGVLFSQGWRSIFQVLVENLPGGPFERASATEPFVGNNAECILITGKAGFSTNLLRSHVRDRPSHFLGTQEVERWCQECQTKIAEQEVLLITKQQISRFDITVDHIATMSIVKGGCDLFDMGDHRSQWHRHSARIELPECSPWSIVHHQDRCALLNDKLEHTYDMAMPQANEGLCLREKASDLVLCERRIQDFQSGMTFQVDMFTEIDMSEASVSKLAENTVIAQLLSKPITHQSSPESAFPSLCSSHAWLLSIVVAYHIYVNDAVKRAHAVGEYTHIFVALRQVFFLSDASLYCLPSRCGETIHLVFVLAGGSSERAPRHFSQRPTRLMPTRGITTSQPA